MFAKKGGITINFLGILIALATMATIGVFHPIVIKAEYYFSKKIWPAFLVFGLGLLIWSLFVENTLLSGIIAVIGASSLWGIHELFQQEKRVQRGLFPENPKRAQKQVKKTEKKISDQA